MWKTLKEIIRNQPNDNREGDDINSEDLDGTGEVQCGG